MEEQEFQATGKRKTSIATVYLKPGTGKIVVNGKKAEEYFHKELSNIIIKQPMVVTDTLGRFDVSATVKGGGLTGQCDALRHGITRALVAVDESYRVLLKQAGLLTRDAREKERKKYGLAGARRGYQFSKR